MQQHAEACAIKAASLQNEEIASRIEENNEGPSAKKVRLQCFSLPSEFEYCQSILLATSDEQPSPHIPETLTRGGKAKNCITKLRQLMDFHGFRTSIIHSPRPALSIYKDSCHLSTEGYNEDDEILDGKIFLVTMFGFHPNQLNLEHLFATYIKNVYCLLMFCRRLRDACPKALQDPKVEQMILAQEQDCRAIASKPSSIALEEASKLSAMVPQRVHQLIQLAHEAEPRNLEELLEREYHRIELWNSTLSNALVSLFLEAHELVIKDIYFKSSHESKYERITIYVYDTDLDVVKPPHFMFLPALTTAVQFGLQAVVKKMTQSFWSHLLRFGYFATTTMKTHFNPELERFLFSGLTSDANLPLKL